MPLHTRRMDSSWRCKESFCHSACIANSSMKSCAVEGKQRSTSETVHRSPRHPHLGGGAQDRDIGIRVTVDEDEVGSGTRGDPPAITQLERLGGRGRGRKECLGSRHPGGDEEVDLVVQRGAVGTGTNGVSFASVPAMTVIPAPTVTRTLRSTVISPL